MAGAPVQHKETNIASYDTTIALAFDSNVTAGNLIDVFVFWNNEDTHEGGSTAADGLSNTYTNIAACNVGDNAQARSVQVLYAKNITGGACTVTVTLPGNRTARYLAISEWSGLDTTAPADQGNGAYQAAVTAVATGNVTPGSDGQTILSSFRVTTGATTTITEESTVVYEDETNVAASQYETQSSAASIAGNWTLGAARNVISVVRTYKPAAAGATLEQEGYRGVNDDGSESAATFAAAQDAGFTMTASQAKRLRALLNATGDPAAGTPQLEYRKQGESPWLTL